MIQNRDRGGVAEGAASLPGLLSGKSSLPTSHKRPHQSAPTLSRRLWGNFLRKEGQTGDLNFPQLSPGSLLRTGKAWGKPSSLFSGIKPSGLVPVRHGRSPLVDSLRTAEVDTSDLRAGKSPEFRRPSLPFPEFLRTLGGSLPPPPGACILSFALHPLSCDSDPGVGVWTLANHPWCYPAPATEPS